MKKFKNVLLIVVLLIGSIQIINAQTYVSGGIYSNITWSLANSPYIITDTVVVFPNATLIIESGVTIKFNDSTTLEIRGNLITSGTSTDSITFTSNSVNPTLGIWGGIFLRNYSDTTHFDYCNVLYSANGIYEGRKIITNSTFKNNICGISGTTMVLRKSKFVNNTFAIKYSEANIDSCLFNNNNTGLINIMGKISYCDFYNNINGINIGNNGNYFDTLYIANCLIRNNQNGIFSDFLSESNVYIKNCIIDSNNIAGISVANSIIIIAFNIIKFNAIGIENTQENSGFIYNNIIENNTIGIKTKKSQIYCNKICNNSNYDFYYYSTIYSFSIANNYWCTSDSTTISMHIYDGYDNINFGILTFMPLDTSQCYLITGIKEKENNNISFNIFPNPAYDKITLILPMNNLQTEVKIYNLIGQLEIISKIENTSTELNILKLTNGIYIIELTIDDKIIRKKFCKQ